MSQEDVEIVRVSVAAWRAGDMDALRELYDDAPIMTGPGNWATGDEPTFGQEEVIRFCQSVQLDADGDHPISFVEVGERVVVRLAGRTVGTDAEPQSITFTYVFTL